MTANNLIGNVTPITSSPSVGLNDAAITVCSPCADTDSIQSINQSIKLINSLIDEITKRISIQDINIKQVRSVRWRVNTYHDVAVWQYKKAVLSQRRPRNAPYTWCPKNFHDSLTTPKASISNIFHGLLFRSTLWMFLQNLKSVALPVPEIIGGTPKIWALPGYAHALFSPKFLMGFYSDWPCKCTCKIWSP